MRYIIRFLCVLLPFIFITSYLYAAQMNTNRIKNLSNIDFPEKKAISSYLLELTKTRISNTTPYSLSISMIASAALDAQILYPLFKEDMLWSLDNLESPIQKNIPQWMRSNSFKAWMWGRVLLSADSVNDTKAAAIALGNLWFFLDQESSTDKNPEFYTWAWAYRAAYNQQQYAISKDKMLQGAYKLTETYQISASQTNLSNALWAWVMNLQAAAYADDQETYEICKEQIKFITKASTVTQGLNIGLIRSADSNDYPAWAIAKVRYAASIAGDEVLYSELDHCLNASIAAAKKKGVGDEYALAMIENQLAIHQKNSNTK